jgi:hypothetical protein
MGREQPPQRASSGHPVVESKPDACCDRGWLDVCQLDDVVCKNVRQNASGLQSSEQVDACLEPFVRIAPVFSRRR